MRLLGRIERWMVVVLLTGLLCLVGIVSFELGHSVGQDKCAPSFVVPPKGKKA